MGRKLAAGLVLLGVLCGIGWLVLRHVADQRLQLGIAQLRSSLAPDGSFTYASAQALPLHLGAMFSDVTFRKNGMVVTMSHVTLDHAGPRHLGSVRLLDVHFQGNGVQGAAASIDADDLSNPSGKPAPDWKDLQIGHLRLHSLAVQADRADGISMHADDGDLSQIPATPDKAGSSNLWMTQASIQQGNGDTFLTVDRVTQHADMTPDALSSTTDLFGLSIPAASLIGRQLAGLSYDGAKGDGRLQLRYAETGTPAAGRLAFGPLLLRLDGVGQFGLTVGLDHLPSFTSRLPPPPELNERMAQTLLTGMSLNYNDAGLANHALELLAQRSGMSTAALRAALIKTLEQRAASDGGHGFEQEAIRFLNDPRHMAIALHPPAPLSLPDLGRLRAQEDQVQAIAALGLTIKAD